MRGAAATTAFSTRRNEPGPGDASTSRHPRPRYGWAASHATGAFFGTDPGAGSGKMSEAAEWCSMWPVLR
jgi:hypothetical protein